MTGRDAGVSLRDYVDTRIGAFEERFAASFRENEAKWAAHLSVMDSMEKRISSCELNKLNVGAHDALEVRIQALEKVQARVSQQRLSASQIAVIAATVALASLAMNLTTVFLLVNHILRIQ